MDSNDDISNLSASSSDNYLPPEQHSSAESELEVDTPQEQSAATPIIPQPEPSENRGRKRAKNQDSWIKNTRKRLRNKGEAYRSVTGKNLPKKIFNNINCGCKKKCYQKFEEEERKRIFQSFWNLGDYTKQNIYIRSSVLAVNVKRKRKRDGTGNAKTMSYEYILRDGSKSEKVCKKYFLDTFYLTHGRVYRCISKPDIISAVTDLCGRHSTNKIDDSDIVEHIKSFPAHQSHYNRTKNPERKYLNPDLNIKKIYDLYVTKSNNEGKVPQKKKTILSCVYN
ncbi:uncharacterized protein [Diabrotica undecimpunctata]|uniref:uncharacterized protein n=1 Tax=Diabrotica undecimpunctata TaxID=50387 RepID=UPI003B63BA0D